MKQITQLKEGNKGFLNLPQFETIWRVTPVTELTMGSAEVLSSIALSGQFFPANSTLLTSLQLCLPRLLHLLNFFSHIRICFSGIHYKAASDNTSHQNYLNCCSKHSPSTPMRHIDHISFYYWKGGPSSFGLRRQAKNQRNQSQSLLTLFCLLRFCLYPRTPLTHQEKRLIPYKNKIYWRS